MSQIGMNLRVTECCDQGGRKYMEDRYAVHFERNEKGVVEFGYFGVFDGHGGAEAAKFARDRLLEEVTKYDEFWTDDDQNVCQAIKAGFLDTHKAMWKERDKWPMTSSGFPSTSGTTASVAFIKNCKLYVGHVGDSAIVLGQQNSPTETISAVRLTKDHKPESPEEQARIERSGGCVMRKAGVNRVVWNRPKTAHRGPVRRSTQIDQIPFLAVARSLGDLWSYDYKTEEFVVSPEPDVSVRHLFPKKDRCLILGSDGLWNMLSADDACSTVHYVEKDVEKQIISDPKVQLNHWVNVSERLVKLALHKWQMKMMRADNTSAMVVMIDPLGPSRWLQLRKKREDFMIKNNLNTSRNLSVSNNNKTSSVPLTPDAEPSDNEIDRNAPTPIINADISLPLTPQSASPKHEGFSILDIPMDDNDFDEVDGDLSIVSTSRLPSIGSEIVIDSTANSASKLRIDDVLLENGDLDDLEADIMEENMLKNFKSPMKKKPTVPLLRPQNSFMTFSGSPPRSLKLATSVAEKPVSAFSGHGSAHKLQKLQLKKIGGSPQKFPDPDSSLPLNPFLSEPDSPTRLNPFTSRPGVEIVREYLTNPDNDECTRYPPKAYKPLPLLPGKPGDKVEIIREYLTKKNPEDTVTVSMPKRSYSQKEEQLPIISKTKRFNVTIIREYLMKKKKKVEKKKKQIKASADKPCHHSTFVGEVCMPSCSNSVSGQCGWSKWLTGAGHRSKRLKKLKGRQPVKMEVMEVSNKPSSCNSDSTDAALGQTLTTTTTSASEDADVRRRSLSLTNLTDNHVQTKVEPKKAASMSDVTKADKNRKRSSSLGSASVGHVLKMKNGQENSFSSLKTRNSPRGFSGNMKDSLNCSNSKRRSLSEQRLTGKEQINLCTSPALVRRVLRKKTPVTPKPNIPSRRSKSASKVRQNLTRSRFSTGSVTKARSHTDTTTTTPVRVLRSLMGLKRKASSASPEILRSKRMRTASNGRHS